MGGTPAWPQNAARLARGGGTEYNTAMKPALRFDGCLSTNLEEAYRSVEQVYESLVAPLGLSVLEWYALRALYTEDGLSASHLAALLCRHPSSMTALLDRMEQRQLLRRETDSTDRRSVRVFLTDQGRALQPEVEGVLAHLNRVVAGLTAEQMAVFLDVLAALQRLPVPVET